MKTSYLILTAAFAAITTCVSCGPSLAETERAARLYNRGMGYMADARFAEAAYALDSAAAITPNIAEVVLAAGVAWGNQARDTLAVERIKRAISLNPDLLQGWYSLGYLAIRTGRNKDAVEALNRCGGYGGVEYLLGVAKTRMGQSEDALAHLERAVKLSPQLISAHYALSQALKHAGKTSESETIWERFVYLKEHGGTAVDLGGDLGLFSQGVLAELPLPDWGLTRIEKKNALDWTDLERILPPSAGASSFRDGRFADMDGDGTPELLLIAGKRLTVLSHSEKGWQTTQSMLGGVKSLEGLALGDWDNDGDPDVALAAGRRVNIWTNNGGVLSLGTVLTSEMSVGSIMWGDFDHDARLDLIATGSGKIILWRQLNTGEFLDVTDSSGLGAIDLADDATLHWLDTDMDNAVDLIVSDNDGLTYRYHNLRDGTFSTTPEKVEPELPKNDFNGIPSGLTFIDRADVDGDGLWEAVVTDSTGAISIVSQSDGKDGRKNNVVIRLVGGQRSNRDGTGATVDIAMGTRWVSVVITGESRFHSAGDLLIPVPPGRKVDMVRVTWPSGIRQAVLNPNTDSVVIIREKPGESASCPFVFTWNGEEFEFINDAIGGSVMGVPLNPERDLFNYPDPDEYLLIGGNSLVERDGILNIRIVESLAEVTYLDQIRLFAVDHPRDVEVLPDERMAFGGVLPDGKILSITKSQPVVRAIDGRGVDVTDLLSATDRRYVEPGHRLPYRGYTRGHSLTLDLGPVDTQRPLALIWHGWVRYFSTLGLSSAAGDGVNIRPPRLEIPDGAGGWKTIIASMGIPAGMPRSIVTNLTGLLPKGVRKVRMVTNMTLFWDQVRVVTRRMDDSPVVTTEIGLHSADFRWAGYPVSTSPDGRPPFTWDYQTRTVVPPYAFQVGNYTRYGSVEGLITNVDDQYVIMAHGDEIALQFKTKNLPDVAQGWKRDYIIYLNGYMKEIIEGQKVLTHVEPLPFHDMKSYPPASDYPDDIEHRDYRSVFNSRRIADAWPKNRH